MITVYHLSIEATDAGMREAYLDAVCQGEKARTEAAIKALWGAGHYHCVGTVHSDDVEHAYEVTQNGVRTESWSRQPVSGVEPIGAGYRVARDGRKLGFKSSAVGDVFVVNGEVRYVASFGFEVIDGLSEGVV